MGAGPPRFGLRPRFGLFPGADPDHPVTVPTRRTIHYPGPAVYPGRAAYPFVRWIIYPNATTYPGTELLIRSGVRAYAASATGVGRGLAAATRSSMSLIRQAIGAGLGRAFATSTAAAHQFPAFDLHFDTARQSLDAPGRRLILDFPSNRQVVSL